MQQVLFRIPFKTAWFPERFPFWAAVVTLAWVVLIIFWVVARLGTPRESGRWSFSSALPWLAAGIGATLLLKRLLTGVEISGGVPIYGFGMMLFLAFLLCTWLASRRAEREGVPREAIQDLAIWLFVSGLIGARVTFLLHKDPGASFLRMPYELLFIWEGGIILYGAVLGGLAGFLLCWWFVFRKQGVPALKLADIIAPAFALGLCLGRIGCFLNGCCYGQVACVDCPVYSVHFPLSAPARYSLVGDGSQTSAGFTFASEPQAATGVRVGQVEPGSAAARAGLKAGDVIEEVDGQRWFTFTEGSLLHLEGRGIPEAVLDKLKRLLPPPPQDPKELAAEPTDFTRQQFEDAIATVLDKNERERYQATLMHYADNQLMLKPGYLSKYLGGNWPRGKTDLTLKVAGKGTLTFTPRTLGLHPTQLYESISMLLLFVFLTAVYPLRRRDGQIIALLMVCYGLHRYFNELLRNDPRPIGFERYSSVILIVAGIILALLVLWRRPIPRQAQLAT